MKRSSRDIVHEIIFEADTPSGKLFDLLLIACIVLSILTVMLDSVQSLSAQYGDALYVLEWVFTILFTIEYFLRLWCVRKPFAYAGSFYGIVDLLSILPSYLSIIIAGSHYLLVIRALRMLRLFRVLKLAQYITEASALSDAMHASKRKIFVFLYCIVVLVVILGSLMYIVEAGGGGFTSIPKSIYWAIVTLTTVGYGDISPQTPLGQILASLIMIIGYAIIAVPTGIVTAEMTKSAISKSDISTQACPDCGRGGHSPKADYCMYCGSKMHI
ncbi:MAG: ion transporter [Deltaproteobacteria bacterium]|nr:ion transporter [Deltaproteobacteria bacterium]